MVKELVLSPSPKPGKCQSTPKAKCIPSVMSIKREHFRSENEINSNQMQMRNRNNDNGVTLFYSFCRMSLLVVHVHTWKIKAQRIFYFDGKKMVALGTHFVEQTIAIQFVSKRSMILSLNSGDLVKGSNRRKRKKLKVILTKRE